MTPEEVGEGSSYRSVELGRGLGPELLGILLDLGFAAGEVAANRLDVAYAPRY